MGIVIFFLVSYLLLLVGIYFFSDDRSDLEKFLETKNLSSVSEVDYWTRRYGQKSQSLF
jgi:hypothetical protein